MRTLTELRQRLAEVQAMIKSLPLGEPMSSRYLAEEQTLIAQISKLLLEEEKR